MNLYIHFPYCLYKCHYCDFNSYPTPTQIPFQSYTGALMNEIDRRRSLYEREGKHFFPTGRVVDSLFFGGGTPSLMPPSDVGGIIRQLAPSFTTLEPTEITLEANPKTVTPLRLVDFKKAGVNRLSLGVQSLHDAYLTAFGRIHSADDARQAIDWVRLTFEAWNVDLIFGFPGQTLREWIEDLKEVISFSPPHLSCYAFTVEQLTPYAKMIERGEREPPDEDLQAEMFELTAAVLKKEGYERYEISNYTRPGFESRHNLNYWNYGEYVGLGAGGVSFFVDRESWIVNREGKSFGYRTTNFKTPEQYMRAIHDPRPAIHDFWFDTEQIDRQTAMSEFMMMGLRLKGGVDPRRFFQLFGCELTDSFYESAVACRRKGWFDPHRYALTPKGVLFANQAIQEFFA